MRTPSASHCADQLLALAPQLMQTLRVEMRAGRPAELTVPQFRSLVFFSRHPGGSISEAAEHLGLGLPSASKVAEGLVARGLLSRRECATDRRRAVIALTEDGRTVLTAARDEAAAVFAKRLAALSALELSVMESVLERLQELFGAHSPQADEVAGPGFGV